jgi:ankyrin repeat protein
MNFREILGFRHCGRFRLLSASIPFAAVIALCVLAAFYRDRSDPVSLFAATQRGDTAAMEQLLQAGTRVDTVQEGSAWSPLTCAARFGHVEAVERLLDRGADVNYVAGYFGTPLANAAYSGKPNLIRLLILRGADPNRADASRYTPLMWAAASWNLDAVRVLIEAGADVNARDLAGNTALMIAAAHGQDDIVEQLLRAAADPIVRDHHNRDAATTARESGFLRTEYLLRKAMVSIQSRLIANVRSRPKLEMQL